MGRGMLYTTALPPSLLISMAGAYTEMGLMDEPTGMFISEARLSVLRRVGCVRPPTMAFSSPVR